MLKSRYKIHLFVCVFSLFMLSNCEGGLLIDSFEATDDATTANWNGFAFSLPTGDISVEGLAVIDVGTLGFAGSLTARLWRFSSASAIAIVAGSDRNFTVMNPGTLQTDPAFTTSGVTEALNGFRVQLYDAPITLAAVDAMMNPYTYLLGVTPDAGEPVLPIYQQLTLNGVMVGPPLDRLSFTVDPSIEMLTGSATIPIGNTVSTALPSPTDAEQSFGVFGANGPFGPSGEGYPFLSGSLFNPISVNLFIGTLEEPPVVPEPSSMILMVIGVLCGVGWYRRTAVAA